MVLLLLCGFFETHVLNVKMLNFKSKYEILVDLVYFYQKVFVSFSVYQFVVLYACMRHFASCSNVFCARNPLWYLHSNRQFYKIFEKARQFFCFLAFIDSFSTVCLRGFLKSDTYFIGWFRKA